MNFIRFIVSQLLAITIVALCVALWCIFAYLAQAAWYVIIGTAAFAAAILVIWLIVKYAAVRRRTKKLRRIIAELKEGYLLGETLPEPYDAVRWEYYAIMKRISRSAISRIGELEESQEEYRAFIEQWIHEIKTPLTSCALLIKNGGDPVKVRAELKKADNIAENVLYFVRLRTPQGDIKITSACLSATAQSAVKDVMELMISAGISVEVKGDWQATTDHKAISFCLRQLLVNAAKYCKGCKVTIEISPEKMTVTDNGCGISAHELPCIFNRGFVGEAGRKLGGGTGMGLYLVKQTCKNLGVNISAQSQKGEYTRFTFTFDK